MGPELGLIALVYSHGTMYISTLDIKVKGLKPILL